VLVGYIATRAKNLFCAARAASRAPCSVPRDKPCTIILGGLFCRTCHFQRAAFPGVCQFPGDTTISMLSVSINAIWQILAYFYTGYPCHIKLTRYPKDDRRSREGATAKASWRSPRGGGISPLLGAILHACFGPPSRSNVQLQLPLSQCVSLRSGLNSRTAPQFNAVMTPMRAIMVGRSRASTAACHSSSCCLAFGSFWIYLAASSRVMNCRPRAAAGWDHQTAVSSP
jgi:hypothetical protein